MDKRAIVSLIYPEKIIFNGSYFQTTKINSFVHAILLIRGELSQQKKREFKFKKSKSPSCDKTSVSSNTFIDDLVRLSQIRQEL
jgi:hypothetical protein